MINISAVMILLLRTSGSVTGTLRMTPGEDELFKTVVCCQRLYMALAQRKTCVWKVHFSMYGKERPSTKAGGRPTGSRQPSLIFIYFLFNFQLTFAVSVKRRMPKDRKSAFVRLITVNIIETYPQARGFATKHMGIICWGKSINKCRRSVFMLFSEIEN